MRMTFAEIYLQNFSHNISEIKKNLKRGVKMCVAVKADAYGHGAARCAKKAAECGADFFSVATVEEGAELRKAKIKEPVLLLSLCSPGEMRSLVKYNLTPLVGDEEYVCLIENAAKKACESSYKNGSPSALLSKFPVHLAVDTGMGRIGCLPDEAARLAKRISSSQFLSLGGVCTHFASADDDSERGALYAKAQSEKFFFAVSSIKKAKIKTGIVHAAASAALLSRPEWQFDMVRPGIILYGYYPGCVTKEFLSKKGVLCDLKPVMALVTKVSAVREFCEGMSVSYGSEWTAKKRTNIAVLPVGYADGLLRRGAGKLKVSIGGKAFPVRGRICMDQCMAEVGFQKVGRFSRAVIFGPKESGALFTAEDLAREQGTISYEILTCISKRVRRVFVE